MSVSKTAVPRSGSGSENSARGFRTIISLSRSFAFLVFSLPNVLSILSL